MTTEVDVYISLDGADIRVGRLYAHRRRSTESTSFGYAEGYLGDPRAFALDPQLPLVAGLQQSAVGLPLFRAFADSSPDRWGRNLVRRQERLRSRDSATTARTLGEFELLLGVRDDLRQGAVRFRRAPDPAFLAAHGTGVPVLTDLPGLLGAADRLAADDADHADLAALVRAGSSRRRARLITRADRRA